MNHKRSVIDTFTRMLAPALVVAAAQAQTIDMGPIVNPANRHVYYRLTASTWTAAEAAAAALGGNLVTINDVQENAWVFNTFSQPGQYGLWIGLNDALNEGTFLWSSGEPFNPSTYHSWAPGQPDNWNPSWPEDFGMIFVEEGGTPSTRRGLWNDLRNVAQENQPIANTGGVMQGVVELPGIVGQANSPCASLTVNGNGGAANGPFVVAAPAGGSLNLAWSGPANQPIALVASPNFIIGQNWFGNVVVDLDMTSSVVLFDGLNPLSRLLYSTNASSAPYGTTFQTIPIPPIAAGSTLRLQGVVFDFAGVCPNPGFMTTAAFEVRL